MKHIVTTKGFEVDLDESCVQDMELFESVVEVEKGNTMELPSVVDKIMGAEKKRLYDFLRDENGRVPVNDVLSQITEIIQGLAPKNS